VEFHVFFKEIKKMKTYMKLWGI